MKYLQIKTKTGLKAKIIFFVVCILILLNNCDTNLPDKFITTNRLPAIYPDYNAVTIPPNIAPLNFKIEDSGISYQVKIKSRKGKSIVLNAEMGVVSIPIKRWQKLLYANRGAVCTVSVYVKHGNGVWNKYAPVLINIADTPIDPYLVYRRLDPGYRFWSKLGIYQRNITNFMEKAIFTNDATGLGTCMNCHSFCKQNPNRMLFHMRGKLGGTMLMQNGVNLKINTKTPYTMSAGVYTSWHPNGNLIAFSVNKITQYFSSQPHTTIDVLDKASDIVVYNIKKNMISTSPKICTNSKENLPEWSPDGRYLYYCVGNKSKKIIDTRYNLMRIAYDAKNNIWGDVDTVLSSTRFKASISFPRISPDGKYLLFCGTPYGYFTINYKESDLYVLNLKSGEFNRLNCNSKHTESYHSWSGNSRWFVFSSKRDDGLSTRLYLCYFDKQGRCGKPFVLPQKDPNYYNLTYQSYNVPELISGQVKIPYNTLKTLAYSNADPVTFDPDVDIDALSGASRLLQ